MFECAGAQDSIQTALEAVAPAGCIVGSACQSTLFPSTSSSRNQGKSAWKPSSAMPTCTIVPLPC